MTALKHQELQIAQEQIESSYHPKTEPDIAIPFAADSWDGLYLGFSIVGLAGYFGLAIPVLPLIIGGVIVAAIFLINKIASTHRAKRELLTRLEQIDQNIISENHLQHWKQILPKINNGISVYSIEDYLLATNEDEILVQLAYRYRRINNYIDDAKEKLKRQNNAESLLKIEQLNSIRSRLALQIAGEASHISDYQTAVKINKYLGQTLVNVSKEPERPHGKRIFDSVSQYTKSILDGVSTGASIPYTLSLIFMLTTTVLTMLFPWTFLIIGVLAIAGGIMGYKMDKYYDNKAAINEARIDKVEQSVRLKKTYINIIVQTKFAEQEIRQAINEPVHINTLITAPVAGAAFPAGECIEAKRLRNPPPSRFIRKLSVLFPSLLSQKGRRYIRNLSRAVSMIFPSLLSGKKGFDVISDIFYGIVFTTSIGLAFLPFAIFGLVIGAGYLANKIYRGVKKYQRMDEDICALGEVIKPIKYTHWEHELGLLSITTFSNPKREKQNIQTYVQQNDIETISQQFIHDYNQLEQKINAFDKTTESADTKTKLAEIRKQLQLRVLIRADEINNSERSEQLRLLVGVAPAPVEEKNLTRKERVKLTLKKGWSYCVENYKDFLRGFGLGTGVALTIFAAVGVTSLTALMPYSLLIIVGAGLLGIGLKLLIRHVFKKPRWAERDAIDDAKNDILDKEQIMDALVTTKRFTAEANQVIAECNPKAAALEASEEETEVSSLTPSPEPARAAFETKPQPIAVPIPDEKTTIKQSDYLQPWLSKLWQDKPASFDNQEIAQNQIPRQLF